MADALVLGASTSVCGFKSHLPHHVGTSFARSDFFMGNALPVFAPVCLLPAFYGFRACALWAFVIFGPASFCI